MEPDFWHLYRLILKSRLFEQGVMELWNEGEISGEMHLAIGEEAISAGIISQLEPGDALALDHRGSPQMLMRGVKPELILLELLGHEKGLCRGMGGHMHLYSREHLSMSSGIVGASGPAALGFAISAQYLRPEKVAVAFFGEAAVNQGMLMESFNLASTWELPVIFICKDNRWSITTESEAVTSGKLTRRAKSFDLYTKEVDGSDVLDVWKAASKAIGIARSGKGPSFLHMHCVRPEGHFLGDPLLRIIRNPLGEAKKIAGPLIKSTIKRKGSSIGERSLSLGRVGWTITKTYKDSLKKKDDPLYKIRKKLKDDVERLERIDQEIEREVESIFSSVMDEIEESRGAQ
jgi:pyruvate dehydrogenase E1 component alpha subunit